MPCIYCGESGVQSTKDRCKSITKNKRLFITDTEIRFNGIDRLDSSKGYFMDNVVSCCKHCNSAKNILTTTEFKNHIIKIYEHYCK
jgi:5-methylcytosine-specific restriction endonuclease McrA